MHSEYVIERQMAQDQRARLRWFRTSRLTRSRRRLPSACSRIPIAAHAAVPLELLFQQVEAVTVDADIITLRVEEGAGTVDHWHLTDAAGASHITWPRATSRSPRASHRN
jgi:hypothetical protein